MISAAPNLIVFGNPAEGGTKILTLALRELHGSAAVDAEHISELSAAALRAKPVDAAFFVLDDYHLVSAQSPTIRTAKPCTTVEKIWQLVNEGISIPIHVAIPHKRFDESRLDTRFTALDTLALSLSGVRGIWEISASLLDDGSSWTRHWRPLPNRRGSHNLSLQSLFLFGRPAVQLHTFFDNIMSSWWPATQEMDREIDKISRKSAPFSELGAAYPRYGFQIALALATLGPLDLVSETDTKTVTQDELARRIYELQDRTGCVMGSEVIAKVLGRLLSGWQERYPAFDRRDRQQYPFWAQQEGFPARLPLIRTVDPFSVGELLFQTLDRLQFEISWDVEVQNEPYPLGTTVFVPSIDDMLRRRS